MHVKMRNYPYIIYSCIGRLLPQEHIQNQSKKRTPSQQGPAYLQHLTPELPHSSCNLQIKRVFQCYISKALAHIFLCLLFRLLPSYSIFTVMLWEKKKNPTNT